MYEGEEKIVSARSKTAYGCGFTYWAPLGSLVLFLVSSGDQVALGGQNRGGCI